MHPSKVKQYSESFAPGLSSKHRLIEWLYMVRCTYYRLFTHCTIDSQALRMALYRIA